MKSARSTSLEEAIAANLGNGYIPPSDNPIQGAVMLASKPPPIPAVLAQSASQPSKEQNGWSLAVPTAYNSSEDQYGSTTAKANPATGRFQAVEGQSIAVDPKVIPYGSTVEVQMPDGSVKRFLAHDTGSAVVARTAAKKRGLDLPVIDFYSSRKDVNNVFGNEPIKYRIVPPSLLASN